MTTYNLISDPCKKNKYRKGRGIAQGRGKTCGRGQKGQRSRAGAKIRIGFEGGQTPLYLRIPKFGFYSDKNHDLFVINLQRLSGIYVDGEVVSLATLREKKIISTGKIKRVKVLGDGECLVKVTFAKEIMFSKVARQKITQIK